MAYFVCMVLVYTVRACAIKRRCLKKPASKHRCPQASLHLHISAISIPALRLAHRQGGAIDVVIDPQGVEDLEVELVVLELDTVHQHIALRDYAVADDKIALFLN